MLAFGFVDLPMVFTCADAKFVRFQFTRLDIHRLTSSMSTGAIELPGIVRRLRVVSTLKMNTITTQISVGKRSRFPVFGHLCDVSRQKKENASLELMDSLSPSVKL